MGIPEKLYAAGNFIMTTCVVLVLSACQEDVVLLGENGVVIGKGTLVTNLNPPSLVSFTINGKAYTGSWRITNVYDPKDEKRYKLMGSRSYENYMAGNAPDQLKIAHAELLAEDGTGMTCDFSYRRQPKEGSCSAGGKTLKLIMQHQ